MIKSIVKNCDICRQRKLCKPHEICEECKLRFPAQCMNEKCGEMLWAKDPIEIYRCPVCQGSIMEVTFVNAKRIDDCDKIKRKS